MHTCDAVPDADKFVDLSEYAAIIIVAVLSNFRFVLGLLGVALKTVMVSALAIRLITLNLFTLSQVQLHVFSIYVWLHGMRTVPSCMAQADRGIRANVEVAMCFACYWCIMFFGSELSRSSYESLAGSWRCPAGVRAREQEGDAGMGTAGLQLRLRTPE